MTGLRPPVSANNYAKSTQYNFLLLQSLSLRKQTAKIQSLQKTALTALKTHFKAEQLVYSSLILLLLLIFDVYS